MADYGRITIEIGVDLYYKLNEDIVDNNTILIIEKDVVGITRDIMLEIMDTAQRWCPVDTGFLKSTGRLIESGNFWEIVYDADYAKYVENTVGWLKSAYDYVINKHRNADRILSFDDSTGSITYKT